VKYFVIVYDRGAGRLLRLEPFEGREAALEERFRQERLQPDAEVVLLAARSEDALRRTHGRYFTSVDELLRQAETAAAG